MEKKAFILFLIFVNSIYTYAQQTVISLEAERGELSLPSKVKYVSGYSENAYVGDNDMGSSITFRNIEIEKEGTYEFRTYYTSMHIRSIAIRSDNYPKVISTCPQTTLDWNTPPVASMVTYIYLNKGSNKIIITPHDGGAPNIDKFEIRTTAVSMPRPQPVNDAFVYDLTDDATVTTVSTTNSLSYVSDNDLSTICAFNESVAEIYIKCDMPYLLTGYLISAGAESAQNLDTWKMEYSIDGNNYTPIIPSKGETLNDGILFHINRTPHNDKGKVAQYYKLTIQGGKVAELQLFGIPYIANSYPKNFPIDITDGSDIRQSVVGVPLGVYQYGSFDERCYNLFDRDMSKKYYWNEAPIFSVEIELPALINLQSYTLTSCQDYPERDPQSWVVEGFDRDWEVVSEVVNFKFPTRYATMKFYTDTRKNYKGYRLRTIQNNGANAFQLLKWQLFGGTISAVENTASDGVLIFSTENGLIIQSQEQCSYKINNLYGQLITTGNLDMPQQKISLDKGLYVVQVYNGKINVTSKIIVK